MLLKLAFVAALTIIGNTVTGAAPPPTPEPIDIIELALPPVIANTTAGACSRAANHRGTGCIAQAGLNSGSFTPDGTHVAASVTFIGAPAAPDPASIYTGLQFILIKADNTTFPNGDTWKCITCGVPAANMVGSTELSEYPQTFRDGKRAMSGINIIDCGTADLISEHCTPDKIHIYPIRLSDTADDDGTGPGASLRELRLHPDNVHLTFNSFIFTGGSLGELAGFGRLQFNATSSRYDIINAYIFGNPKLPPIVSVEGDQLFINRSAISVGELRGMTGTGKEIVYVGYPWESSNIDLFACDLTTGAVRRITAHPEYADPIAVSPDDKWQVVLDTRGSDRLMFMAAIRTIPPLTDLLTVSAVSSVRNNGPRRFFEPYLIDHDGDRNLYFGQKINAAGDGSPGSINDPYWNAGADPRWSLDGMRVVYYQMFAASPACGGTNPLPCRSTGYADGRQERVMVATFPSRKPLEVKKVPEAADEVPWALKYVPGAAIPAASPIPAGNYIHAGQASGSANVTIAWNAANTGIRSVAVEYHHFSDDGCNIVTGFENVTFTALNLTNGRWDWYSDITSTGPANGTKLTSRNGFHLEIDELYNYFLANGTLTSSIDGNSWFQPCNNC